MSSSNAERVWRRELQVHDRQVLVQASHVRFLLAVAAPLIVVLVLMRLFAPNTTIASAAVPTWCLFVLIDMAAWPISLLLIFVTQLIVQRIWSSESLHKPMYIARQVTVPCARALWSIAFITSWLAVFGNDPFPALDANGDPRSLDSTLDDWITRMLACIIAYSTLNLGKEILVALTAFKVPTS
jgi:hypothetical protein